MGVDKTELLDMVIRHANLNESPPDPNNSGQVSKAPAEPAGRTIRHAPPSIYGKIYGYIKTRERTIAATWQIAGFRPAEPGFTIERVGEIAKMLRISTGSGALAIELYSRSP